MKKLRRGLTPFQVARALVSLQRFLSDPNPSVERGAGMLHHSAFLHAPPRFWMHPLLWVEDVKAAWPLNVFPLLLFCHRVALLRIRLDRL